MSRMLPKRMAHRKMDVVRDGDIPVLVLCNVVFNERVELLHVFKYNWSLRSQAGLGDNYEICSAVARDFRFHKRCEGGRNFTV